MRKKIHPQLFQFISIYLPKARQKPAPIAAPFIAPITGTGRSRITRNLKRIKGINRNSGRGVSIYGFSLHFGRGQKFCVISKAKPLHSDN